MTSTPDTPASIGRFRIDAVLGRGGMGEVYKAFDPTLHRTVALKTVRPGIDSREYLDRLYREAQACAQLTHPNIVTVFDAGEIGGSVYIAMEYVTGENLATILQRGGLTFEERMSVLLQMLDALQHAHEGGVIHRDVKPANVIRQPNGTIKLVDFGLARTEESEPLTQTGVVMGTIDYASPEQLRGEHVDHRSDIYSTGVVAYELLAGKRPFVRNSDLPALIYNIVHQPPPPLNEYLRTTFPALNAIVLRAIAKSPDDRYLSAIAMREALAAFLRDAQPQIAAMELARAQEPDPDARTGEGARATVPAAPGTTRALASSPAPPAVRAVPKVWLAAGLAAAVAVLGAFSYFRSADIRSAGDSRDGSPGQITSVPTLVAESRPTDGRTNPAAPLAVPSTPASMSAGSAAAPATAPLLAPAAPAVPAPEPGARDLYEATSGTLVRTGLHYRVFLVNPDDDTEAEVDPEVTIFKTDARVRFQFESNVDGFVYVVHQGTSGAWTLLFPNPEINGGQNAVKRAEPYRVPSNGRFKIDGTAGAEKLFVFLSTEPVRDLPGFDRPASQPEAVLASVTDLQKRFPSRDLVFEKSASAAASKGVPGQSTYVVNRNEMGRAVAATITLTHGK